MEKFSTSSDYITLFHGTTPTNAAAIERGGFSGDAYLSPFPITAARYARTKGLQLFSRSRRHPQLEIPQDTIPTIRLEDGSHVTTSIILAFSALTSYAEMHKHGDIYNIPKSKVNHPSKPLELLGEFTLVEHIESDTNPWSYDLFPVNSLTTTLGVTKNNLTLEELESVVNERSKARLELILAEQQEVSQIANI